MSLADLPEVCAIENRCYSTPWSLKSFEYEIGNKDAVLRVAIQDDMIAGYLCVRTILDVTHLLNITVRPELRGKGTGSALLKNALEELKSIMPNVNLTLEVREANMPAIKLYEKFGFRIIGRRKKYYQKPDDDALLMELRPG